MTLRLILRSILLVLIAVVDPTANAADAGLSAAVTQVIRPLMQQWGIPGMAVGVTSNGRTQVLTFGVRSLATRQPLAPEALFEIGSISKTFTATLAAYAQEQGALSLFDPVERFLPELRGTPFGALQLVNLGTHTPGGLPLQVPDSVETMDQMLEYFKTWKPSRAPGTIRTYNNPGIGALGLITARSLGRDFGHLIEGQLLPGLGLHHTYLHVPADRQAEYAQGYTSHGQPIRMTPGVFWEPAYGIKTTAGDLLIFLGENLGAAPVRDPLLARAIQATHTAYFRSGVLTQDLIWEQYATPVAPDTLLQGNSAEMIYHATPATALIPPLAPRRDVLINKTGSTAGFGAYVAYIPQDRLGVVLLANKNYPIDDRVRAGYSILMSARRLAPP